MYKIIENPVMLPKQEIDRIYEGKWVFLVNAQFTPNDFLIEGIPVVVGDIPFDGVDDGIYEQYRGDEYGKTYSYTLLKQRNLISSVFNVG